jgi:hypothetical protein
VQVMSAVSATQAAGHDKSHGKGGIVPALAKNARTGHPEFRNWKGNTKAGPPAGGLSLASTGYWASAFVHEGVHMMHQETGTPANERRSYFEQYRSVPPFHVTGNEANFIKEKCGANCY